MKKYVITGLLIWIPLVITIWVLALVVDTLDRTLLLLPESFRKESWLLTHVPGMGVVMTLVIVFLTGVLAANIIGERLVRLWNAIAAPTLWVAAAETHLLKWLDPANNPTGHERNFDGIRARIAHIPGARLEIVSGAGHMLHHDQPAAVARLIEPFFAAG